MVEDNQQEPEAVETETPETETEAPESGNDLRATLEAAMANAPQSDEEPASTQSSRSRDEKGRFARNQQNSDQATQVKASEAANEQPIAPPYSWSAEHKELFSQLPRPMQEYLTKRETERESFIGRKSQETKAIQERYAPVDRIVEQYGDLFRRANLDPMQGLENLVLAQKYLDQDPVGALQLMAQSYGLDLSQLAGNAQQTSSPQAYPQMHYLNSELDTIRSKLAAMEQEKIAQQQQAGIREVETFANEMDGSGKLLRPHIADVHEQMLEEIPLIRSRNPEAAGREILQQAYEVACWKNPTVRARLIESERQPQVQAARVQQAKLAGSSVRGAPGASSLAAGNGSSIRDALLAAFDSHS